MNFKRILYIAMTMLSCFALTASAGARVSKSSKGGKKFTVVIDAGHGGKDTGAIDNGVKEKDINLSVALDLAEKLRKNMKNVNVVLTRDNDTFISLQQRADKANNAKADLFISIHTNSVDASNKNRRTVEGASVYALGLHKDANNMAVARRENSVIELEKNYEQKYSGFDPNSDESYIIFEMAQKNNLNRSIRFANEVQKQLVATAGRRDRKVHQAGFWVLWATSMPSVLIELDFICNPNSAKFMASRQGSEKLAQSIFNAVKKYREDLDKRSAAADIPLEIAAPSADGIALLQPASERKVSQAPEIQTKATSAKQRRRRSESSREISESRNLETAAITVKTHATPVKTAAATKSLNTSDVASSASSTQEKSTGVANKVASKFGEQKKASAKKASSANKAKKVAEGKEEKRIVNNKVVIVKENSSKRKDEVKSKATAKKDEDNKISGSKNAERGKRESLNDENHLNRSSLHAKRKNREKEKK